MTKTEPNNFTPNGVVCEFVSYCNRNKVFVRVAKGIDTFFLEKEQITPIRLTPEILEKNGWHKYQRGYLKDNIYLVYDSVCSWSVEYKERFVFFIRHVHQLQHLLFGLGIKHEMEV